MGTVYHDVGSWRLTPVIPDPQLAQPVMLFPRVGPNPSRLVSTRLTSKPIFVRLHGGVFGLGGAYHSTFLLQNRTVYLYFWSILLAGIIRQAHFWCKVLKASLLTDFICHTVNGYL